MPHKPPQCEHQRNSYRCILDAGHTTDCAFWGWGVERQRPSYQESHHAATLTELSQPDALQISWDEAQS